MFNAVSRVDDFAFTPEQSISSGMMTFVSQNRGAKEYGRMRMGLSRGLMVETGYWMLLFCVVLPLRAPIMRLFVGADESAVALGASYLFLMAFFYLLPAYTNGLQGYFRGLGDMKITLAGTFTQISVRVVFVYLLVPAWGLQPWRGPALRDGSVCCCWRCRTCAAGACGAWDERHRFSASMR